MKLESSFEVPARVDDAWRLFMDTPRVIPCMPGATLVETVDDRHWKADIAIKLGPIGLTFATDVERQEADEAAGRVVLGVSAREKRGRGRAAATVRSDLDGDGERTHVHVVTDLTLTGPVAQYGRGLIEETSSQLVDQFAANLRDQLQASSPANGTQAQPASAPRASSVSGFRLLLRALAALVRRRFSRRAQERER